MNDIDFGVHPCLTELFADVRGGGCVSSYSITYLWSPYV